MLLYIPIYLIDCIGSTSLDPLLEATIIANLIARLKAMSHSCTSYLPEGIAHLAYYCSVAIIFEHLIDEVIKDLNMFLICFHSTLI